MSGELLRNLALLGPESTIVIFLVALFLCDAFVPQTRESYFPMIMTLIACIFGSWITWQVNVEPTHFFSGLVANDGISNFFRYIFFFACGSGIYLAYGSRELPKKHRMEFTLLLLCVTFGMSLMAISTHLLMLYIGIETVSIVSFVMAGFSRDSLRSNEASFKYLVFGALASGLMLYGFSLIYGYTGSLQYREIASFLAKNPNDGSFVLMFSAVLIYAGLAYKISAFPMHFWTPDVYEGSPTPVASFFSIGPKAAGFAALLRICLEIFAVKAEAGGVRWEPVIGSFLVPGIALVSALTMIVGNLSAIGQTNVKRILAYSSIAHVGYMLMGLVTLNSNGLTAILFYLVVYCAMNVGAFWVVSVIADMKGSEELEAFRGTGWQMPVLGVSMAIFLFSLTGIPMFSGFIGKFLLFGALIQVPGFLWLALLGVLNSVISLYYYAKVLKAMWLDRPETAPMRPERLSFYHAVGIVALAVPTVVLGLFFTPVVQFAQRSIARILS